MGLTINGQETTGADVGVLLGRGQPRMPEQFLNNAQIGAGIQEVGRKGMP
jgi:hypothetical protein